MTRRANDTYAPTPRHEIAVVVGRTGSGKTELIRRVLAPAHPRRITIDVTGECEELYPNAHVAVGFPDALRALETWASRGLERWHLVAVLDAQESAALAATLVPIYRPGKKALSADLGGVCLECSELDVYLPVSGANATVTAAWTTVLARGRHASCSIIAATQRPAQVARIVTSQASRVIAFATHEPLDVQWLARVGGARYARAVRELGPFQSAWYHAGSGRVEVRNPDYTIAHQFRAHDGKDFSQTEIPGLAGSDI